MNTYKIPVTIYIEAHSVERAEQALFAAIEHMEGNCGLRCYAQVEYNTDETNPPAVLFDWGMLQEDWGVPS